MVCNRDTHTSMLSSTSILSEDVADNAIVTSNGGDIGSNTGSVGGVDDASVNE